MALGKMAFYPINLDIHDRLCVVVGGGSVAVRKVESLLVCGARVKVISPVICDRLDTLRREGKLELIKRVYREGDLEGSCLVFAATDQPNVQQVVVADARQKSIPINVADSPKSCTFQVPATLRRDELLITVSTGGGSPLLAAKIRNNLEDAYGAEYGVLVKLLSLIREQLLALDQTEMNMKNLFEKLLRLNIVVHIQTGQWRKLRETLTGELPEQVDIDAIVDEVSAP